MGNTDKKCSDKHTMRLCGTANIGSKWQIVIPKEVRETLWLKSWDSVSFMVKDEKFLGIIPNDQIEVLLEYVAWEKNISLIR